MKVLCETCLEFDCECPEPERFDGFDERMVEVLRAVDIKSGRDVALMLDLPADVAVIHARIDRNVDHSGNDDEDLFIELDVSRMERPDAMRLTDPKFWESRNLYLMETQMQPVSIAARPILLVHLRRRRSVRLEAMPKQGGYSKQRVKSVDFASNTTNDPMMLPITWPNTGYE